MGIVAAVGALIAVVVGAAMIIQKTGQWPSYEIDPDIIITNYLTEEDKSNYKKALTCLSVNYGIGAYAYFRRIIENETKRIVKDIGEMDFDGSEKIKNAYANYERDHQMSNLISSITQYLPKSLTELGDNPIKLLHDQLSGGIHSFSESVCLDKAGQINIILGYVIKKVNEEKYQVKDVRAAISKLKKNGG